MLSFSLVNTILAQWFDPSYAERETRKDLVAMSLSLDSLASELENRDLFIQSIRTALEGEPSESDQITSEQAAAGVQLTTSPNSNLKRVVISFWGKTLTTLN